jgi:phosphoribosylamine--glycine ligase/phosphoribosylformylglycinamidine cyclo-ligase
MLTDMGPRVLEFNCRFGDPETQSLMPLLESDLAEICLACIEGRLDQIQVRWSNDYAACIVLASAGYPGSYESGKEIEMEREIEKRAVVFHAGTKQEGDKLVTAGGRVLAVTSTASTLSQARIQAYAAAKQIRFEGRHYRKDIGEAAIRDEEQQSDGQRGHGKSAYAAAGVDIEAKLGAFQQMRAAIEGTYTPAVLAGVGAFGGLFDLRALGARDPVLVASTDGVGTKTMIATALGCYDTVGHDIVNHCVNDILVQGARPLFFLDYVAASKLDPERIAAIVRGCAEACRAVGCVLLGGETAEMPGVYQADAFDLVGTLVGWVERDAIVDGRAVRAGDVCLGLPSSGLHTNGYSLARSIFADTPWETVLPELGKPLGQVLLTPHRSYLKELEALWAAGVQVKAMAHITGGGFTDNIPRVLPADVGVHIDRSTWKTPAIFELIQEWGHVDEMEMYRVFNMGIGMVLVVAPEQVNLALNVLKKAVVIGRAVPWDESTPRVRL